jgi:uncharacterized protein YjdB
MNKTGLRLPAVLASIAALILTASCGGSFFVANSTITDITLSPANPSIQVGGTTQMTATGKRADGQTTDITPGAGWTVDKPNIATVSSTGLITGVSVGTAKITAKYERGEAFTFATVTSGTLQSITITPSNSSITVGATQNFVATGNYSDGTTQVITTSVTWTSSNAGVATITQNGQVTGVTKGTTTIQAVSSGITGSTSLTVN